MYNRDPKMKRNRKSTFRLRNRAKVSQLEGGIKSRGIMEGARGAREIREAQHSLLKSGELLRRVSLFCVTYAQRMYDFVRI